MFWSVDFVISTGCFLWQKFPVALLQRVISVEVYFVRLFANFVPLHVQINFIFSSFMFTDKLQRLH